MKHEDFRKQVLSDKDTENAYYDDLAHDTGTNITRARLRADLTQHELALKLDTTQSVIARLESGGRVPSLQYLRRIALALDTYLVPPSFLSIQPFNQTIYINIPYTNTRKQFKPDSLTTKAHTFFSTPEIKDYTYA